MPKGIANEIIDVLRQFELAGQLTTKREISHVKETSPRTNVRLISFVYEKTPYVIIYDAAADDDTEYLREHIHSLRPQAMGEFVRNPHDDTTTYGLRHKFREVYLFEEKPSSTRLDKELAARYPDQSRSTLQKYIKAGYVMVNGEVVRSLKKDVNEFDDISLTPPKPVDMSKQELPIIYIDDNVIVVNKPSGVLTHSKGALNDEFTVADFFRRYTTYALETNRPGIVHRLDRDTSGVIIGARNAETAKLLKDQFAHRLAKKQYSAVVDGLPKQETALIDLPIARNPSAPSTFRVDPKGKPAQTVYKVVKTNGKQSLVELTPKTGRTHQLRVHMQYIGTPIAGDRVYGNTKTAPRLCLHAEKLEITIPTSKRQTFIAKTPASFAKMVAGEGAA